MQTKLRVAGVVVVASLLWISPTSALSQRAKVQGKQNKHKVHSKDKKSKIQYIGTASWYGGKHQGRKMANGKRFDCHQLTAASWYFPLGTTLRVVNVENGESVVVTITDRGPNKRLHRILDLSESAAELLDYVGQGVTPVFVYPLPSFETSAAIFDTGLIEIPANPASGNIVAKAAILAPM
jgi:rare lipoprotein A